MDCAERGVVLMTELERAVKWLEVIEETEQNAEEGADKEWHEDNAANCRVLLDALRWIPVTERPEKAGAYFVCIDMAKCFAMDIQEYHAETEVMYYSLKHDRWTTNSIVTHWRPLPPKPEGE